MPPNGRAPQNKAPAHAPSPSNSRWLLVGISTCLTGLVWLAFGQTLHHDFVNFDDDVYVYGNSTVQDGLTARGMVRAFTQVYASNWHPLTMLSHMLDCQLYGLNAGGHHLTNLLLHTAAAILLFLALRQLTGATWPGAFVAAVFAIHPLRVESVAWISERKDVLSGLFAMLTLWAYGRYAEESKVQSSRFKVYYGMALVFFTLGLMSKPMLVTLPLVLLMLDYWPLRRLHAMPAKGAIRSKGQGGVSLSHPMGEGRGEGGRSVPASLKQDIPKTPSPFPSPVGRERETLLTPSGVIDPRHKSHPPTKRLLSSRLVLEKIPFLLLSLALGIVTVSVQAEALSRTAIPFSLRLSTALVACATYVRQLFYPVNLAVLYPYPATGYPAWQIALSLLFLVTVSGCAYGWRRKHPYLLTGWLWYLTMLLPVLGFIQAGAQARADRFTYLPQIGLCIALTWLIVAWSASWRRRQMLLGATASAVLVALCITARIQVASWRDSESLWSHTLARTRDNAVAENNLAGVYVGKGRYAAAILHAREAIRIDPHYENAHGSLGLALLSNGQRDEALVHFREALKINPDFVPALNNLGMALMQAGQVDEAIAHFEQAIRIQPDRADLHNNLGGALSLKGRMKAAVVQYERAIQLKPDYAGAELNLAWILATSPDPAVRNGSRAVQLAQHARQRSSGSPLRVLRILAAAYAEAGRYPEAVQTASRALELAMAQTDTAWVNRLQAELQFYHAGQPFRDTGRAP
jgi:Tfp pilus assembly protein PilF